MTMTNAQRQKAYRERKKARNLTVLSVHVRPVHKPLLRRLATRLEADQIPFPEPLTQGEAAVLLQVLRSIRSA